MEKVKVKLIKRHPAGLKEGEEREFSFLHAKRLKEQGYVEIEDYDQLLSAWEAEEKERGEKITDKIAALKKQMDDEEANKVELRQKGVEGKEARNKVLQTTDDIQNEQPKNPGKGKGGKNK